MAHRTIPDVVSKGEREEVVVNERRCPPGSKRVMAFDAIGREARHHMVRVRGGLVVRLMAIEALIADPCERGAVVRYMAIHTAQVAIHPHQRKAILLIQFRNVIHQPAHRGMAARTIITDGHAVNVRMARNAVAPGCLAKDHGGVARFAIHFFVHADQGKFGLRVIESHRLAHRCPTVRDMAGGAIDLQRFTMRRLRKDMRRDDERSQHEQGQDISHAPGEGLDHAHAFSSHWDGS